MFPRRGATYDVFFSLFGDVKKRRKRKESEGRNVVECDGSHCTRQVVAFAAGRLRQR